MRNPIPPDPKWGNLEEVTALYRAERCARVKTRLNAIRLLIEGAEVQATAKAVGACVATVRNWRTRWNRAGKEGLKDSHKGSVSRIDSAMRAEIKQIVEVTKEIDGKTVTGKLIVGHLKKNTSCR